jgi:hypothetical protein
VLRSWQKRMFSISGAAVIGTLINRTKRRTATPSKEPPSGVSGYGSRHDTGRVCFSARLPQAVRTGGMGVLANFAPKCLEVEFSEVC